MNDEFCNYSHEDVTSTAAIILKRGCWFPFNFGTNWQPFNEASTPLHIYRWHRAFKDGRESVETQHVGGGPRTVMTDVNINTVSVVIEEEHHSSIWKLADDLHIPVMSIQWILTKELRMKRVCLMWVPHFLHAKEIVCRCSVVWNIWHISHKIQTFSLVSSLRS